MILSFRGSVAETIFKGQTPKKGFPTDLVKRARAKLLVVNAATSLHDLRSPGNELERLHGDLTGFWGVRVNDAWRVAFRWEPPHARDVGLHEYHSGYKGAANRGRS